MVIAYVRLVLISIKHPLSRVGYDSSCNPGALFGGGQQFVRNRTLGRLDATAKRNPIN
jgi:hypothetical protein